MEWLCRLRLLVLNRFQLLLVLNLCIFSHILNLLVDRVFLLPRLHKCLSVVLECFFRLIILHPFSVVVARDYFHVLWASCVLRSDKLVRLKIWRNMLVRMYQVLSDAWRSTFLTNVIETSALVDWVCKDLWFLEGCLLTRSLCISHSSYIRLATCRSLSSFWRPSITSPFHCTKIPSFFGPILIIDKRLILRILGPDLRWLKPLLSPGISDHHILSLVFQHLEWVVDSTAIRTHLILFTLSLIIFLNILPIWVKFIESILFLKDNKLSVRLVSLSIFINRNSIVVASHVDFSTCGPLLRV